MIVIALHELLEAAPFLLDFVSKYNKLKQHQRTAVEGTYHVEFHVDAN